MQTQGFDWEFQACGEVLLSLGLAPVHHFLLSAAGSASCSFQLCRDTDMLKTFTRNGQERSVPKLAAWLPFYCGQVDRGVPRGPHGPQDI